MPSFFFQDLDRKGPSLMSIGSNATSNGYNITYKSVKKKKKMKNWTCSNTFS